MNNVLNEIQKLREHLDLAAFLVSKGGAEREAHGKIVESLVILYQIETEIKNNFSDYSPADIAFKVSSSEPRKRKSYQFNEENKIDREVEKVTRRLPRWFRNHSQNNSAILFTYLRLAEQTEKVSLQALKDKCNSVRDFDGNYSQMKNFGEKNHGKVFEERDGCVKLWEPVKEYILKLYNENKG